MPAKVRIVLVEPQEPGNAGAVARAMKNFGFSDLVVVGTLPRNVRGHEIWWASGAEDLLDSAREVATLEEALSGVVRAFATSSMRGRNAIPDLLPSAIASERMLQSNGSTVAIVFGREDSGLTMRESQLCHGVVQIETNPSFAVMNLAQAVAVLCYAASQVGGEFSRKESEDPVPPALYEQESRVHQEAQALLLEIGFLQQNNPDRIYDEVREIADRARLTARDVTLLLGILRQARWKLGQLPDDETAS